MIDQREESGDSELERGPATGAGWAVPSDATFFLTVLGERVRSYCPGAPDDVPVVLLQLADGTRLDLCHVAMLAPRWIGLVVFRDAASCEEMDLVCVPYETIVRVTVSSRPADERRIGFQAERSAAAMSWPVEEG